MFKLKNVKRAFGALALAMAVLSGCSNLSDSREPLEYGSITIGSDERAVYTDEILSAIVTVTGYDANGTKFEKKSGSVAVSGGKADSITVTDIPVCKNAAVVVKAFSDADAKTAISGVVVSARTDIKAGKNPTITVDKTTSAEGNIYSALISGQYNTNNISEADVSSISNAIPAGVSYGLVKSEDIAADYKSGSLGTSDKYKATPASITVNSKDVSAKVYISDPNSEVQDMTASSSKLFKVSPGTWKIYVVEGSDVSTKEITVGDNSTGTVSVEKNTSGSLEGKTVAFVKADSAPAIWAWEDGGAALSSKLGGTWDISNEATLMTAVPSSYMENGSGWYMMDFSDYATGKTIKFKLNFGGNEITGGAGTFWYDNGSVSTTNPSPVTVSGSTVITVGEISGPVKPSVTLPSSAYIGETFVINVQSNVELTSSDVKIGNKTKTLVIGDNTFNVSDFTSSATTLTVSGVLKNSAGSTDVTGSISVTEKPVNTIISDWNQITMFQVMVSSFQDGDSSRGYTDSYGPSGRIHNGDLQGIINALDYIKGIGCNALWMTPIFNSAGKNGEAMDSTGYYTYDYFNIDPKFGTNETFKTLVKECHDRGIAVILDGVVGHWSAGGCAASPNGKTPSRSNGQYKGCDYPASLDFFKEVLSYWIKEYKIDGWRLDQAYQAGARTDEVYTGNKNYWPQLREAVESAAKTNGTVGQDWGTLGYMCGEVLDGNQANIQKWVVVDDGLRSCFDFPSRYKLCNALVGGSDWADSAGSDTFVDAMTYTNNTYSNKGYTHSKGYYPNLFFANHDLFRFGDLIINWKNYSYGSDNYVGKYKVALSVMAAYTGPITIYYGDEYGDATQGISLIKATNQQVGKGAYWDNSSRTAGHIDKAQNGTAAEKNVLAYTTKIMNLRNEHEALWNGSSSVISGTSKDLYAAKKSAGSETIYVAINNGTSANSFNLPEGGTDLITGTSVSAGSVSVPALSAMFIKK